MILFLSSTFLRNLQLVWKPDLKALLVGDRNLFFLIPDALVEISDVSPEVIDAFLKSDRLKGNRQLLGSLAAAETPEMIGYAQVQTGGIPEPEKWAGRLFLLGENGIEAAPLQIRMSHVP